jgi:hypothetical protein
MAADDPAQLNHDQISTTQAAQMLGWHVRKVRRNYLDLGGRKIAGRLMFDANTIREYMQRTAA